MPRKQKENKSKGAGGRPRSTTPPPKEVIELGKEMVEWFLTEPVRKKFHFKQWYSIEKKMLKAQWDNLCAVQEFNAYYEQAQAIISQRYMDGSINPGIAQRFLRLYFPELKKDEDDKAKTRLDYEYELKKQISIAAQTPPNDDKIDDMIESLKALKSQKKKDK